MHELDFRSRKNIKGGSPKGRDVRRCPEDMHEFIHDWGVINIGGGNESYFTHNPNAKGRFTKKRFEPLIPILKEKFPEGYEQYFGGREWNAAYLVSQRFHKMYHIYDKKTKTSGRGKSREHPEVKRLREQR